MTKMYYCMRWLYLHKLKYLSLLIKKLIRVLYACDIFPTTDIGKGCVFQHGGAGTVIHERCKIGANCEIYQNVTIGGNGKKDSPWPRVPMIGDNVKIYAGACLLGPITIGNNVVIGANAVVLCNMPDDSIAVGVPARVLARSEANE